MSDIEIRPADLAADADAIRALNTSFETDTVFEVTVAPRGFRLTERHVQPAVSKRFPLADLDKSEWEHAWVALQAGCVVGVVATQHLRWNKRAVVWHLYVEPDQRLGGVGRRLLDVALETAREAGLETAWIETSSVNVPGVRAYERLGFHLCGLDLSLYGGTAATSEVALFLSRSLV